MAMTTTANPADVANRLQTFFSKKLLEHAQHTLRLADFAMKAPLPRNSGSKTIRFFRPRAADASQVQKPTEGVAISTFTEVALAYVDVTLQQFAQATKVSDVLKLIDLFPVLQMNIATMGEDCALQMDSFLRDALVANAAASSWLPAGQTTLYGSNGAQERFGNAITDITTASATRYANLLAAASADSKLTRAKALTCVTQLKVNKTPKINGKYVCIVPPQLVHDLRQDADWLDAAKYSSVQKLYNDEIGELDGVRYVEATNPFIEGATYGAYNSAGTVFTAFYFGKDAYGAPELSGNSPYKPSVMICDKPDKSDPANQFVTATWKAFWGAILLNSSFVVALRAKTTYA
jgi:N4-gp56 family major capsid protein